MANNLIIFQTICDALLLTTIFSAIVAAKFNSTSLSIFTGIALVLLGIASHNYFHRRDNWRMYCFNLCGLNYREWRVSHAISHHMYPNTKYDVEVANFEPLLMFTPVEKSERLKVISVFVSPVVWLVLIKTTMIRR